MRIIVAIIAASLGLTSAHAGEQLVYEHNGSVIDWFVAIDEIRATYSAPRADLVAAGVKPGTLLFEGRYEGNKIVGKAYTFKRGCPPLGYEVIGREEKSNIIELRGPAPRRDGCQLRDYSLSVPDAILIFKFAALRGG